MGPRTRGGDLVVQEAPLLGDAEVLAPGLREAVEIDGVPLEGRHGEQRHAPQHGKRAGRRPRGGLGRLARDAANYLGTLQDKARPSPWVSG